MGLQRAAESGCKKEELVLSAVAARGALAEMNRLLTYSLTCSLTHSLEARTKLSETLIS